MSLPMDPIDEANLPPEDLDQCQRCGGYGVLCPTPDPQDAYDCPVCAGDGVLPEYLGSGDAA